MSFTGQLSNEILDNVFGAGAYTPPANLYIGLSTSAVNDDGTGATEPADAAYERVAVVNDGTNFPAAANGAKANGAEVRFAEAGASWGTITHFFIADAASAGNILAYGSLNTSKAIESGDIALFGAGSLTISLD